MSQSETSDQNQNENENQRYYCPTCGLRTNKEIGDNTELEIVISYRAPNKDTYSRGWYACLNCMKGLTECVER
jgi:hypothetical protein